MANTEKQVTPTVNYESLIKENSRTAILTTVLAVLFNPRFKCDLKSLMSLISKLGLILIAKTLIMDYEKFIDSSSITNIAFLRYFSQYLRSPSKRYFFLKSEKSLAWINDDQKSVGIDSATFGALFNKQNIDISIPGTYYARLNGFFLRIIIDRNITIFIPKNCISDFERIYIYQCKENYDTIRLYIGETNNAKQFSFISVAPNYTYPVEIYVKLKETIRRYILFDSIFSTGRKPLTLCFNGPAGTGKTSFVHYLAKNIDLKIDAIFIVNMKGFADNKLDQLISNRIDPQIKSLKLELKTVVILFDEIDKWLESMIMEQIKNHRNASKTTSTIKGKEGETITNKVEFTAEDEKNMKIELHHEFLDQLYNLCEGKNLNIKCKHIIIFNTNEFERLFDNTSSSHEATRKRININNFDLIGKDKVIEFLRGLCKDFSSLEQNVSMSLKEEYEDLLKVDPSFLAIDEAKFALIPDRYTTNYRDLYQCLFNNHFRIGGVLDEITSKE